MIQNNNFTNTTYESFTFGSSSYIWVINNTFDEIENYVSQSWHSDNLLIKDNSFRLNGKKGVWFSTNVTYSTLLNNSFLDARGYAIQLMRNSSNNKFINNTITSTILAVNSSLNSTNNTFINCNYSLSNESVSLDSSITRKWYYQAKVNDSLGNNMLNGNLTFNGLTDVNGYTDMIEILDYVNTNGTINYSSPYSVSVTKNGYDSLSDSYNATAEKSIVDILSLEVDTTVTIIVSGGGGGGSKIIKETQLAQINLVNPGPAQILTNEEANIPIVMNNDGELVLNSITLYVLSSVPGATLTLSEEFIEKLELNESKEITLNIKSTSLDDFGSYPIVIKAIVEDPYLEAYGKTYLDIVDRYSKNRTEVIKEMAFAKDLFKENPECLEFNEFFDQADKAMDEYDFAKATSILKGTVQACKDAISARDEEDEYEEEFLSPEEKAANVWVFLFELVVLVILLLSLLVYFKKRNAAESGITENIENDFNSIYDTLRREIYSNKVGEAKRHYQELMQIYVKITKTPLPYSKKMDYYQKIKSINQELSNLIMGGEK